MSKKPNRAAYYRLAAQGAGQKAADRIASQNKIRQAAPSSPAYGKVKASLDAWNTSADAFTEIERKLLLAQQALHDLQAQQHEARIQFTIGERTYRSAVEMAAEGQLSVITSLGYQATTGRAVSVGAPPMPTLVVGKAGVDPGAVHLAWKFPTKGTLFQVQVSPDPMTASSWSPLPSLTRRTLKVGDLHAGQYYWFRVSAVRSGQESGWTDPIRVQAR